MTVLRALLTAAAAFAPWLSGCGTLKVTGPEGLRHGCVEQAAVWVGGYKAFDAGTGAQALFSAPYVVIDAGAVAEPQHVVGRPRAIRVRRGDQELRVRGRSQRQKCHVTCEASESG